MKNKSLQYIALGLAVLFSACADWVDIRTKGKLVPEETVNYRYLMNNTENYRHALSLPDVASDDIRVSDPDLQAAIPETQKYILVYTWADEIYSESENDTEMNRLYQNIYNLNVVIDEVMDSKGGTDAEKQQIRAEALVHRAFAYLNLVNVYGEPYRAATAETDQGIPLLTTPRVEGSLARASVAEVYRQIIQDLNDALEYLPDLPEYNFYPSKCAVYALLARTYLAMGDYANAGTNAALALELQSDLNNLNDYAGTGNSFPDNLSDPEVILAKMPVTSYVPANMTWYSTYLVLDEDLLALFDPDDDLRYQLFTTSFADLGQPTAENPYDGRVYNKESLYPNATNWQKYEGRNMGPSVPEMMLIRAECLARDNDADGAMALVNTLRQNRLVTGTATALTASSANEALGFVLEERRRELMCCGLRWMDQRRLADDANYPTQTVTRDFLGTTYTLAPGDARYTFPMGQFYLVENPEIGQIE